MSLSSFRSAASSSSPKGRHSRSRRPLQKNDLGRATMSKQRDSGKICNREAISRVLIAGKHQSREMDMSSASAIMSHRGHSFSTDHGEQSDENHLARFLGGKESDAEAAFGELVRRHG